MSLSDINSYQPNAWKILSRSFAADKVASAYLFHGPEGIGQWPLALNFAALLNCESPQAVGPEDSTQLPCYSCRSCRLIFELNFEALHIILPIGTHKKPDEAVELTNELLAEKKAEPFARIAQSTARMIPISRAREVSVRLSRKGEPGQKRVVIFYRMDRMRLSSADALLKMIEEPPLDTVIILTADRPERLPRTIQSRSQKIRLNRLPETMVERYLVDKKELPESKARMLARLSMGVPGLATELADDFEEESFSKRQLGANLFGLITSGRSAEAVAQMSDAIKPRDKAEVEQMLRLWQSLLRDCHYLSVTGNEEKLTNIDLIPVIKAGSTKLSSADQTLSVVDQIKNTLADLERNVHIHTALAALSFHMADSFAASNR